MIWDLDSLYDIFDEETNPGLTPLFTEEDLKKYFHAWEDEKMSTHQPLCECGSDKTYGISKGIHMDYCPKAKL